MATIKFSQLPNLPLANITAATYAPVVDAFTNYTVTMANLVPYVNQNSGNTSVTGTVSTTGNITTGGNISATGNITGSYVLGNGSQLTGLPATYGNADVAAYLPTFTGNLAGGNANISLGINSVLINPTSVNLTDGTLTTQITKNGLYGNVTATTVNAGANVTSNLFIGNGSALTNLAGANVSGTVLTANTVTNAAQANITSVGVLTSLSSTGNITGSYFFGNGSQLSGITATATNAFITANANGTLLTSNTTSGVLRFSSGNNIVITGTGANNNIQIGFTGTVANATYADSAGSAATASTATTAVTATTATTAGTVTSASQSAITSVGTLTSLSVTGNVSANYFIGNGSLLTGIAGGGNTSNSAISNGNSNVTISVANGPVQVYAGGGQPSGGASLAVLDSTNGGNINMSAANYVNVNSVKVLGGAVSGVVSLACSGKITSGTSGSGVTPFNGPILTKTGTSSGSAGDIAWDANYIYVCTSTNVWKRTALSSF